MNPVKYKGRAGGIFYLLFRNLFFLSLVLPLFFLLLFSFTERYAWPELFPTSFSLRSFKSILFQRKALFQDTLFSMVFSLLVSLCTVLVAFCTAKYQNEEGLKGKGLVAFLVNFPIMIPATVFAMGAQILFLKIKIFNPFITVFLAHVLYALPYAVSFLQEGMSRKMKLYEEQARVMGAVGGRLFWKVSLPLLYPYIFPAFMMSYILSMSQYILTLILGGGKVKSLSLIMVPYIQSGERNLASAYGLIFLCSSFLLFFLLDFLEKGIQRERG